jgi:hypothetical protein
MIRAGLKESVRQRDSLDREIADLGGVGGIPMLMLKQRQDLADIVRGSRAAIDRESRLKQFYYYAARCPWVSAGKVPSEPE